jgi:hypothetical protein
VVLVTIILACMFVGDFSSNRHVIHWAMGVGFLAIVGVFCVAKSGTAPSDLDRANRRPLFGISLFNFFD